MRWEWLGRLSHADGLARQEAVREALLAGEDVAARVLLLEHTPVITLGRRGASGHVVADEATLRARGVEVVSTRRGGDVTYHGPGQLIVYPVVRVHSVVAFLAAVAGALAGVAAELGVPGAAWRRDPAGLWIGGAKLAACGIHLRRGVTLHGFALDVATPPEAWQLVVPCGLTGARTTSLAAERAARGLPPPPPVADVAAIAGPRICDALGRPDTMRVR